MSYMHDLNRERLLHAACAEMTPEPVKPEPLLPKLTLKSTTQPPRPQQEPHDPEDDIVFLRLQRDILSNRDRLLTRKLAALVEAVDKYTEEIRLVASSCGPRHPKVELSAFPYHRELAGAKVALKLLAGEMTVLP
jgi:hypothetical protein